MDRRTSLLRGREGLVEIAPLGTLGKPGNQRPILQHVSQHMGKIAKHHRLRDHRPPMHGQVRQQLAAGMLMASADAEVEHRNPVMLQISQPGMVKGNNARASNNDSPVAI
ncbi:hypothetical protein [Franzmannia pantelleriensis]|uniref:hypothetical protein n=1 Tax=Franzmannia pantelleriensis TaxID=48727 RepID=UPI001FDFB7E4|nr:hypothetical protein [Halomonas pantelleriensis]